MSEGVKEWWKATGIRCLRTFCETAAGVIIAQIAAVTADSVATISDVNWWVVLGASLLATVICLLIAIAGVPEVDDGDSLPDIIEDGNEDVVDTDAEIHDEDDQITADNDDDAGDDFDDSDDGDDD